jgi:hypothetical protein
MLRGTPTPSTVTPAKRQRDRADRNTVRAFDAAAARANQPDHHAYDIAEHKAGLAGEGAEVGPGRCTLPFLKLHD